MNAFSHEGDSGCCGRARDVAPPQGTLRLCGEKDTVSRDITVHNTGGGCVCVWVGGTIPQIPPLTGFDPGWCAGPEVRLQPLAPQC